MSNLPVTQESIAYLEQALGDALKSIDVFSRLQAAPNYVAARILGKAARTRVEQLDKSLEDLREYKKLWYAHASTSPDPSQSSDTIILEDGTELSG